jgi:hypothetical protein
MIRPAGAIGTEITTKTTSIITIITVMIMITTLARLPAVQTTREAKA